VTQDVFDKPIHMALLRLQVERSGILREEWLMPACRQPFGLRSWHGLPELHRRFGVNTLFLNLPETRWFVEEKRLV
jgi:hypothetical protein